MSKRIRTDQEIASELLQCARAHEPTVCIVGNVTAHEIAMLIESIRDAESLLLEREKEIEKLQNRLDMYDRPFRPNKFA